MFVLEREWGGKSKSFLPTRIIEYRLRRRADDYLFVEGMRLICSDEITKMVRLPADCRKVHSALRK